MNFEVDFKESNQVINADFEGICIVDNYSKGYADGKVAGKIEEQNNFWDIFQNNGNPTSYYYAFSNNRFNDDTFNPKHNIVCNTSGSSGQNIFYSNEYITDTKVPIEVTRSRHIGGMFNSAINLKTIRKLIVNEGVTSGGDTAFVKCNLLENITIEGIIVQSMSFSYSPLTVASMKSIISALKNYAGTDEDGAYTIKFTDDCWSALEEDGTAPNGETWADYVQFTLGWSI